MVFDNGGLSIWSLEDEDVWFDLKVLADHLPSSHYDITTLLHLDHCLIEILLRVPSCEWFNSLFEERQSERLEHELCELDPGIIDLNII